MLKLSSTQTTASQQAAASSTHNHLNTRHVHTHRLSIWLLVNIIVVSCMQMAQHSSPLQCLRHILQTEGLSGLCRGYTPTLCRELPGNTIFFTTYEGLRRMLPGRGGAREGLEGAANGSGSSSSSSSSSALAAVVDVAVDAAGAILSGAAAGVVVSSYVSEWVVLFSVFAGCSLFSGAGSLGYCVCHGILCSPLSAAALIPPGP
jgi:hypothetical protein